MSVSRSMPFSDDTEKGLLSCFLQNPADLIADAIRTLDPGVFYHPAHALIYSALRGFHEQGKPVDIVTLSQYFLDSNQMEKIGGPAMLADLYAFVPTPAHYEYYKGILKDKHLLRRIINICTDAIQAAHSLAPNEEACSVLDSFEQAVVTLRQCEEYEDDTPFPELVDEAIERYEQAILNGGQLPGISTGFTKLDAITGGMRPGQVWTIGGGTSDGKSAFAQNITASLGRQRVPVCYFTLEMSQEENVDRFFCIQSGIPGHEYLYGLKGKEQMTKVMETARELCKWPMEVVDVSGMTLSRLRAEMRQQVRDHQVKVVVVDYVQLINPDTKGHTREREVATISAALKTDAKLLGVTIVNLCQLNDDGRLRESRAIGQDADVVLILHVPMECEEEESDDKRELELAKVRSGPRKEHIMYDFHGPTYTFGEVGLKVRTK